jgi:hypothetical protein
MKKKTSPAIKPDQPNTQGNSINDQQNRLEAALRSNPSITTIFARKELDIMAPARVWELRHKRGLNVVTHWQTIETAPGKKHRMAEYVLFPGPWTGSAA